MRLLQRIVLALILLLVVAFAASNMQRVEVVLDPLGLEIAPLRPVLAPLAFIVFAAVGLGLLAGVLLENHRARGLRRDLRETRAALNQARGDSERMHRAMKEADHPDSAGLPVTRV